MIVKGQKPLTIITKRSILDVAAALDPFLITSAEINYYESFLPDVKFYEIEYVNRF